MKTTPQINRRDFLKAASALTAAAPFILPSAVWADDTAPSKRLAMGFIGLGIQWRGLLDNFLWQPTRVLAVCDVDTTRRDAAKKKVDKFYSNSDCATYDDFREHHRPQRHRRRLHRHARPLARHSHPRRACAPARTSIAKSR